MRYQDKKTETLEVRLSLADKRALGDKAKAEGRSVSTVVRALIADYLAPTTEPARYRPSRPAVVMASLFAMLGATLAIPTTSNAADLSLHVHGAFAEPSEGGTRTRTMDAQWDVDFGKSVDLPVEFGQIDMVIAVRVVDAQNDVVRIKLEMIETHEGQSRVLAAPELQALYGETATFEAGDENGELVRLSFRPERG